MNGPAVVANGHQPLPDQKLLLFPILLFLPDPFPFLPPSPILFLLSLPLRFGPQLRTVALQVASLSAIHAVNARSPQVSVPPISRQNHGGGPISLPGCAAQGAELGPDSRPDGGEVPACASDQGVNSQRRDQMAEFLQLLHVSRWVEERVLARGISPAALHPLHNERHRVLIGRSRWWGFLGHGPCIVRDSRSVARGIGQCVGGRSRCWHGYVDGRAVDVGQFSAPCARKVLCHGSQDRTDGHIGNFHRDTVVSVAA